MTRAPRSSLLLLVGSLVLASLSAQPITAANGEEAGHILVLYKTRDENHQSTMDYVLPFLEQAGFTWESKDVEKLLGTPEDLSRFDGILTLYLSSQMVGGDLYPRFLLDQMEARRRICIVGSYGAYQGLIAKDDGTFIEWNESTATINTFFWPFGLEFLFGWTNDVTKLRVSSKATEMVEFQAPLPETLDYYQLYRSVNEANEVLLEVERTDMIDSKAAVVVVTPFGGMLLEGYGYFWSPEANAMLQRVDLVRFLHRTLAGPRPPPIARYEIVTHSALVKESPLPLRDPPKDPEYRQGDERRRVLVIYKATEGKTLEDHPLFNRGELVLNHLGCILDYHPVEKGLPDARFMKPYRGVVTWHTTSEMPDAERYGEWLIDQVRQGRRLVIFQDYGALIDSRTQTPARNVAAVFKELGITYSRLNLARFERFPKIRVKDRDVIGWEHPVTPEEIEYSHRFVSEGEGNRVYLSLDDYYSGVVDLVVVSPQGGMAVEESAFHFPHGDEERISLVRQALAGEIQTELAEEKTLGGWIIDPYRFLRESLGLDDVPAPDYTTLNGCRIFYAHIDGDGLDSVSLIDKAHFAGTFIKNEILETYPLIPQTVSVISKFVEHAGNPYYHPAVELAREIFRLDHIEPASHAATHPFDWVGGDPYVTNPGQYPWKVGYKPTDYVEQIWGSKLFIDRNLVPPGKSCDVMLWSGATNPNREALDVAWRSRLPNLNGGDPIFDTTHPSIAGCVPVALAYGPYRQYFTSAQNDYLYTTFMTGDWGGQRKVLDHFAHTEAPHRILPMNLYYHFYSGIKTPALDALKAVLDHVSQGPYAPVWASRYCRIAEDFFATRIRRTSRGWAVENRGDLRTLRFPGRVHVDPSASTGVYGYFQTKEGTYVHLDGSREREVVLTNSEPATPYLRRCSQDVEAFRRTAGGIEIEIQGFGRMLLELGGLFPGKEIVLDPGSGLDTLDGVVDETGTVSWQWNILAPAARHHVQISFQRSEGMEP